MKCLRLSATRKRPAMLLGMAALVLLLPSAASAYTWSAWNGDGNWTTDTGYWSAGVPSGTDSGALIQSGTVTIDATCGDLSTNSVLVGWMDSGSVNMTGGSLTVTGNAGGSLDQALVIGEHSDRVGTFTQSGGTVTTNYLIFNRNGGSATSTYTLSGGTLSVGNLENYGGTGILNLNGGTFATTGGTFVNGGILQIKSTGTDLGNTTYSVVGGAKLVFSHNADLTTFTNQSITGAGDVEFGGQTDGYYSFNEGYGWTGTLSYTGKTIVNLGTGSSNWWQGVLWLEKDNVFSSGSVLDMQSGKVYIRNSAASGQTTAGLEGNSGTYITTDFSVVQKVNANVTAGSSCTFAGTIGADGTGVGNNNLALTKLGEGTQILSGTNTYTGATTVAAGKLLVNGSLGNTATSVASGATLGGNGSIAGAVTSFGTIAPGVGKLTLSGGLTVDGGTYAWELGSLVDNATGAAGVNWSLLDLANSAVTATNPVFAIAGSYAPSSDDFWKTSHSWTVISNIGSSVLIGSTSVTGYNTGLGAFSVSGDSSSLALNWTPIPEPSTMFMALSGLFGLLAYAWRKRK